MLAGNTKMERDHVREFIYDLKLQKAVNTRFDPAMEGEFYILPTEQTIIKFDKLNALTINETAILLLEKSYDIYKRSNYDIYFQFESSLIGSIIGLTNEAKIFSAIELLNDKGLINNLTVMFGNIIYFISPKGIDMIENGIEKNTQQGNVYVNNNGGNVAINSTRVNQSINNNELDGYFTILEKLITENLTGEIKSNAINDFETIKELTKVELPKKHLIQKLLDNLDKIPILLDIVNKIREYFI